MASEPATQLITFEDWTLRVRPARQAGARTLLMLHGWTGDENSMWAFARDLPAQAWLIAPRAPYSAPPGYSWRVTHQDWPRFDDLHPSAARLLDLLERWGIANGVETGQVDMVGFSQGAAMCLAFSLAYPSRTRRVAMLAGFAPLGSERFIAQKPLRGKSVFVAHGSLDATVPVAYAHATVKFLEECGADVSYCESQTGHKVGAECRSRLEAFLRS
jgi:phospholipase/carboxylesterase